MSYLRRIVTAIALIGVFTVTFARADQLADVKRKGELVVGVLGTDEPNSFIDPATREFIGYEVDLAREVARKIGVRPVFKQVSVAARIPELQQGLVDLLAASLTHNREREGQVDFGLTHLVTGQKVLVRKASGVRNVSELGGKRVVTVKGGTQGPNLLKAVPNAEVITFESSQQAFQALRQGKAVGYINDEVSLLADISKLGAARDDYLLLPQNLSVEPLAFGIRKGETTLKAITDDTLRGLEKSGEANRIFLKWYGPGTRLNYPKRDFHIESDQVGS